MQVHFIPGFHGVKEALNKGQGSVIELWTSRAKDSARIREIALLAEKKGIPVLYKPRHILDTILPGISHQGIVALNREFLFKDLSELINISGGQNHYGLLVVADHVTDEGNMGAIIRTSVFFGAHGLIIPRDRSAGISRNVMKRSSGAYIHLPVSRVVNLGRALDMLNHNGFWIVGAAVDGMETLFEFDWRRDIALVLGSEDRGISRSIRKRCHQLVSIPPSGSLGALNVSVACGVILSEITRQSNSAPRD